jgi:hypothetical protein
VFLVRGAQLVAKRLKGVIGSPLKGEHFRVATSRAP